jgi:hypothetical protein
LLLLSGCSEDGSGGKSTSPSTPAASTQFRNVQTELRVPSKVIFSFRITDSKGRSVLIPSDRLQTAFRIYEDGSEIDYTETTHLADPASALHLDMLLLLDFTNSMISWQQDTLDAVTIMTTWTEDLIDRLSWGHRLCIMEYHDRNVEAAVVSPFSGNPHRLQADFDAFLSAEVESGSSRNWDALYRAVEQFPADTSDARQRLVVAITDGKETSSTRTPTDVVTAAKTRNVAVFVIGVGNLSNTQALGSLAQQTEGTLYEAVDVSAFEERLNQIEADLLAQYQLSYVTLKTTGEHQVRVALDHEDHQCWFERSLDLGSVFGDDRIGALKFEEPFIESQRLRVRVVAIHTPRNIDRFSFRIREGGFSGELLPPVLTGGLCADWTVTSDGDWFELTGPALPFGAIGMLWELQIDGVTDSEAVFEFELDTAIYSGGKTFTYPESLGVTGP